MSKTEVKISKREPRLGIDGHASLMKIGNERVHHISCNCPQNLYEQERKRAGKSYPENTSMRQQVSFSTALETEMLSNIYSDNKSNKSRQTQNSLLSKIPSEKLPGIIRSHHNRKYESYHPQRIPELSVIAVAKERPAGEMFQYQGQEIVQVVEELMEQACILKSRLVEMIDKYQGKICGLDDKGAAGSKRTLVESGGGTPALTKKTASESCTRLKGGYSDTSLMIKNIKPESLDNSNHSGGDMTGLNEKIVKVQQQMEQLKVQMDKYCNNCKCSKDTENVHVNNKFGFDDLSSQLMDKADEIKGMLKDLKSDYSSQNGLQFDSNGNNGQQRVAQHCETDVRRVSPEYTRTSNTLQTVEGARNKSGNIETSAIDETVETNVNTIGHNSDRNRNSNPGPNSVYMKTQKKMDERVEKLNENDRHRMADTVTERTVKSGEKTFREVNTITENDILYPEGRVIKTSKKTVRTEIVEGLEPQEKLVRNVRMKRHINSRTGEVKDIMLDDNEESDGEFDDLLRRLKEPKSGSFSKRSGSPSHYDGGTTREKAGYNPNICNEQNCPFTPKPSMNCESVVLNKRSYDTQEPCRRSSSRLNQRKAGFSNPQCYTTERQVNGRSNNTFLPVRPEELTRSRLQYISTNSEVQGRNVVGCKFSEHDAQANRKNRKDGDLNLAGRTDSYFVELVDDSPSSPGGKASRSTRIAAGSDNLSLMPTTRMDNDVSVCSIEVDKIIHIITQLAGNRSTKNFFVSVLPEKHHSKNYRINVVDKETGNLLGYFYIDEGKFQEARSEGIFDNFLSLFVLNSIGSYNDFKKGINPSIMRCEQCFGICGCNIKEI